MNNVRSVSSLSMKFDFDKAVNTLSRNKVLTKTAQLGLLSRLDKAGFKLSTAKPLIKKADELDVLGVLEASSDKVLPILAKVIDLAPGLLPLAAPVLNTPPTVLFGTGLASLAAAFAVITLIPDNTVNDVALQTVLVIPLATIIPAVTFIGGGILGKISK